VLTPTVRAADPSPAPGTAGRAEQPPRLVLLIVIDQFRADLLTRFDAHYGDGGFRRLRAHGATYLNAHFSYASSATAPGHATIGSGRLPRHHGIIGNEWHRDESDGKSRPATHDGEARYVGVDGDDDGARSPRMLLGASLSDSMKLADQRSRVHSVAMKDRAAIFTAGRAADAAYWWHESTGRFITSTYYRAELPPYVKAFNDAKPADRYQGETWSKLLPDEAYANTWPMTEEWAPNLAKRGAAFPHELPQINPDKPQDYYVSLYHTPFANQLVFDLAKAVLDAEQLGRGPAVDMLVVGLSANDIIGHAYGPESAEVMDTMLRTDRMLAEFLNHVDRTVGLSRCVIALTGDHGVTTNPHLAREVRAETGRVDGKKLIAGLEEALRAVAPADASGGKLVRGLKMPWIYCDPQMAQLDAATGGGLSKAGVEYLRSQSGVANAFARADLAGPPPLADDAFRRLGWRCYHPQRSGDFLLQLEPMWYMQGGDAAGHGAGFRTDRHVPIVLTGPRVRPGTYYTPSDPVDIAVTIAALLGIEPPAEADGRVLHEGMSDAP
jgi:arylsulfatase A-like enzyme